MGLPPEKQGVRESGTDWIDPRCDPAGPAHP